MKNINDIVKITDDELKDLKHEYVEKLTDKKFSSLVNTLSLDDNILMKYTSNLVDSSIEFDNCQNCKGLSTCKNKVCGYMYKPKENNNTLNFEYVACPYKNKEINDNIYKENITLYEVPKSLMDASMKNVLSDDKNRIEVIKYFKYFMDNYNEKPQGVYLYGSFGTGKSYLIAALFNELAKKDIRSTIVYVPEFLRLLKSSFDNGFEEKYDYIKKSPVLLFDDIGAENLTAWARDEILGTILQYRMDENLPTFFTSNLSLEELEEHFSITNNGIEKIKAKRIIERISFLAKDFKLASKDRRK